MILDSVDRQDLEEPARNLVASAGNPLDVVALVEQLKTHGLD